MSPVGTMFEFKYFDLFIYGYLWPKSSSQKIHHGPISCPSSMRSTFLHRYFVSSNSNDCFIITITYNLHKHGNYNMGN